MKFTVIKIRHLSTNEFHDKKTRTWDNSESVQRIFSNFDNKQVTWTCRTKSRLLTLRFTKNGTKVTEEWEASTRTRNSKVIRGNLVRANESIVMDVKPLRKTRKHWARYTKEDGICEFNYALCWPCWETIARRCTKQSHCEMINAGALHENDHVFQDQWSIPGCCGIIGCSCCFIFGFSWCFSVELMIPERTLFTIGLLRLTSAWESLLISVFTDSFSLFFRPIFLSK